MKHHPIQKQKVNYQTMNKPRQQVRTGLLLLQVIIMPITLFYFSPYLPFMGITQGIIAGSVIVFFGQFLSGILFGRIFCGWLCPAGAVQGFAAMANPKTVNRRKLQWIKFILWVPWIAAWISLALNASGFRTTPLKIDLFFATEQGISVGRPEAYIVYLFVLTLVLLLSLIIGRYAFCHTVCWMSPFMIMGRKLGEFLRIPGLALKIDSQNCCECGQCSKVCPMSINISETIIRKKSELKEGNKSSHFEKHHDCSFCLRCADICPKSVITLGFRR